MLKKSFTAVAACFLLVSTSLQVEANQPHWDDGYRIFQDHSPNFIHVEILNVNVSSNKALWFASQSDRVEIEARVLKVVRSENNIQPGMIIPILYNRKAAAGGTFAESPGIPKQGEILPAFVKLKGDHFIPAARHHTFSPLAEQQLKKMDRESVELTEAQIAALRLPEELDGSLRVHSSSDLPLEPEVAAETPEIKPLQAEIVEPELEVKVASTDLPMVDPETPGINTPTVPEAETEITVATETPVIETSVVTEPPVEQPILRAEVVASTTAVQVPPHSLPQEQSVTDTASVSTEAKPKRRTVVVVPPSELRARSRQQEIQSILQREQARREADVAAAAAVKPPETPAPILKAEVVEPAAPVAASVEVSTPSVPEQPAPANDPVSVALPTAETTATRENPYPILRAEPVETPQAAVAAETTLSPPEPSVNTTAETVEPITMPAAPPPPGDEPVTITDFTPATTEATPEPVTSTTDLSERDRSNMRSYADIYLSLQKAGEAADKQDWSKAKNIYQKALQDLKTLKDTNPDFQPFMVEYRIRDTSRKLEQLIVDSPKN